jgi:putative membrane protein
MMLRLLTTTAVVAVGLLAAPPIFAQTGQPSHTAATSAKDALDQEDKTFVREAAIGGMAEVELSKIAQKSENGDVKRFADRMIADHTKANEQLTSIATGLGVDLPKALESEHERIR